VGLFDAERFGRGYGEENDFCMRAAKAGWRHVLAADVFVFHEGSVSFSGDKEALLQKSADALNAAHPDYPRLIADFIAKDPLAPLRGAIDARRAECGPEEARAVLRERAAEHRETVSRLRDLRAESEGLEKLIAQLRDGLAQATAIVEERSGKLAEREQALRERDAEIARLHEGLAHAESLAFARADELERIRRFWLWRFYRRAMSWGADPARKDG
jgi:hypothetical protein